MNDYWTDSHRLLNIPPSTDSKTALDLYSTQLASLSSHDYMGRHILTQAYEDITDLVYDRGSPSVQSPWSTVCISVGLTTAAFLGVGLGAIASLYLYK